MKYEIGVGTAASSTTTAKLAAWLHIDKNPLKFDSEKVSHVITIEEAKAFCVMLLHVTIHLNRRRKTIAYVHKDEIISAVLLATQSEERVRVNNDDLLGYCIEKAREFASFECTCQGHRFLSTSQSAPMISLLSEAKRINLPINDQNGGQLMQSLLTFIGTKVLNSEIKAYTKDASIPVSCIVIHNGKEYMFNSIADYVARDVSKEVTLAVGEVQSSPASQMMVAAAGIMANESPSMLLGITMTKTLAFNVFLISPSNGYDPKEDATGPINFEHLNSSIYQLNDPKGLQKFCKIVAHFFTLQAAESESDESSEEGSQPKIP